MQYPTLRLSRRQSWLPHRPGMRVRSVFTVYAILLVRYRLIGRECKIISKLSREYQELLSVGALPSHGHIFCKTARHLGTAQGLDRASMIMVGDYYHF